jgi:hypothetical protein
MTDPLETLKGNDLYASFIAICVRNAIEDFHDDESLGLTDDVMARLNPVIRRAIWEALELLEPSDDERKQFALQFGLRSIPDYWEAPKHAASRWEPAVSPLDSFSPEEPVRRRSESELVALGVDVMPTPTTDNVQVRRTRISRERAWRAVAERWLSLRRCRHFAERHYGAPSICQRNWRRRIGHRDQ